MKNIKKWKLFNEGYAGNLEDVFIDSDDSKKTYDDIMKATNLDELEEVNMIYMGDVIMGESGSDEEILAKIKKQATHLYNIEYSEDADELFNEVLSLIRSPKFQRLNDDEYLELMKKLKKWFNENVIE